MKPESKAPTPAELASFIAAADIEEECYDGRDAHLPRIRDIHFFKKALDEWSYWEGMITKASANIAIEKDRLGAASIRIPLAECMRELGVFNERTAKDLFCAAYKNTIPIIGPSQRIIGGLWSNARHSGIQRRLVDAMRAERDRRAVERARKGGAAKAEKQRKKFEQEKAGEIQQQAAPERQQAGKKQGSRRAKQKP